MASSQIALSRKDLAISPLKDNRTIRALTTVRCKDLKDFRTFVRSGQFAVLLDKSNVDRAKQQ
jgi:hypothetical protein